MEAVAYMDDYSGSYGRSGGSLVRDVESTEVERRVKKSVKSAKLFEMPVPYGRCDTTMFADQWGQEFTTLGKEKCKQEI